MNRLMSQILARVAARDDDRGATMVEYGILVAVVALVAMLGASALGLNLSAFFTGLGESLPALPG